MMKTANYFYGIMGFVGLCGLVLALIGCGSGVFEEPKHGTTSDAILDPCYLCKLAPTETVCEDCCYTCADNKCHAWCGNTPWYDPQECVACLRQEVERCIRRECHNQY